MIILAGGLMGCTHSVATIESSHWWLGLYGCLVLVMGAGITTEARSRQLSSASSAAGLRGRWRAAQGNVLVVFNLSVAAGLAMGLLLYRLAVGSLAQPSELGGVVHVASEILRCTVTRFQFALVCE